MSDLQILEEVSALVERVKRDVSAGVNRHDVAQHVDIAIGSVINALMFGYRFSGVSMS